MQWKQLLSTFVFFAYAAICTAQFADQSSDYKYYYQLDAKDVQDLLKTKDPEIELTHLHTFVDSIHVDSTWHMQQFGSFLEVYFEQNILKANILSNVPFEVAVLDNQTDLAISVTDDQSNTIKNAKVHINKRKIGYDLACECYRIRKANKEGLLSVKFGNDAIILPLDKEVNFSKFKRFKNGLLYRSPLKYVYRPVRYVVNLPIDGYTSIKQGYSQGTIRRTTNFFERLYMRIACKFDHWNCDEKDIGRWIQGYMVFSKPKYRINDTLKVKAFLTHKQKRAWNKPVIIHLAKAYGGKPYYRDTIYPERAGVVHHEVVLKESLQLTLDEDYWIKLLDIKERELYRGSFHYEDYELTGIELKVEGVKENHYRNQPVELKLTGTDENELPLFDARYQVMGLLSNVQNCPDALTVLKDTLFDIHQTYQEGSIIVKVPDSLFNDCQIDYQLKIKMRTADNDIKSESHNVSYRYDTKKITGQVSDSTLILNLERDGKRITDVPMEISFYRNQRFVKSKSVTLPWTWGEPYLYDRVELSNNTGDEYQLDLSTIDPGVSVSGNRTLDSVHVLINNPLRIPVHYFLYRNNTEIDAGKVIDLKIDKRDMSDASYSLMMTYVWAGKEVHKPYSLVHNNNQLTLKIDQPRTIYPGKIDTITVSVKDGANRPVKGIDVTAFGLTDKFDYSLPNIPVAEGYDMKKKYYNQFSVQRSESTFMQEVDYWQRKEFSELNDKSYYDLIFPGTKVYRHEQLQSDSITQFAPFVVDRGTLKYCNVIYVDDRPVYFGWNSIPSTYSFRITEGNHDIRLRTNDADIVVKNVKFKKGHKTFISVDQAFSTEKIKVTPMGSELSEKEKGFLYPYIFSYELPGRTSSLSSLYSRWKYYILENKLYNKHGAQLTGPIRPGAYYTMHDHDRDYVVKDEHEAYYVYQFQDRRLKMTSMEEHNYPRYANQIRPWTYDDEVLTISKLDSLERIMSLEKERSKSFYVPHTTRKGNGRIELINPIEYHILHIFILNDSDYHDIRLHSGSDRRLHDIPTGKFSLIVIYDDQHFIELRQIDIQSDAVHVINLEEYKRELQVDRFDEFKKHLNNYKNKSKSDVESQEKLIKNVRKIVEPTFSQYNAGAKTITGVITDDTGEPLIGATVLVKGMDGVGAASDIDGTYSLDVPEGGTTLVFSYTGFTDKEMEIGYSYIFDVRLSEGLDLDEVVVTGLGFSKHKKSLSYGVSAISANNMSNVLQGRAAGVTIRGKLNESPILRIRGNSELNISDPLIIIDGAIYNKSLDDLDPDQVSKIHIIKGAEAVAIYGSKATDGVIIVTTTESIQLIDLKPMSSLIELPTIPQDAQYSIRSNFDDAAFWEPSLTTDKNGEVSFTVKFPDDVTKWETFAIAMDKNLRSGAAQGNIRSYKPLLAELKLPRFLTAGDQAKAIGNISNYAGDSISVSSSFRQGNDELIKTGIGLKENHVDTLLIKTPSNQDSIQFEYRLDNGKGYIDGEIRDVMIQPLGMEKRVGDFIYLPNQSDTILHLAPIDSLGESIIWIDNTSNGSLIGHLEYLESYKYGCNEQLSSRLIGHLIRAELNVSEGKQAGRKTKIRKLIKKLVNNQNEKGLWSWYGNSESVAPWTTNHVMRALSMAKSLGYDVKMSDQGFREGLWLNFDKQMSLRDRLHLTDAAMLHGDTAIARKIFKESSFNQYSSYRDSMHYAQVASSIGDTTTAYLIRPYLAESGIGNTYITSKRKWGGYLDASYIFGYAAMQADSAFTSDEVTGMKNHFYKTKSGRWYNTYSSALWLYFNWKDLLIERNGEEQIILQKGIEEVVINSFPYIDTISSEVQIVKKSGFDLYISSNQHYWDTDPERLDGFFEINTSLHQFGEQTTALKSGDRATLKVKLKVTGTAEHVVLRIPIPAACSYDSKPSYFRHAVHAEYFREEVAIFYKSIPDGEYVIDIPLSPRFGGTYSINPAQAFMMYNPDNQGNTAIKVVEVE